MDIDVGGAAALFADDGGAGADADQGGQGAGGDQGGGAPGGGDQGAGGGDQQASGELPDWATSLSGDAGDGETASNRDYVKAKGFKDMDSLVKAYRSAEKGLHESGRIKVPGEGASAEDVAAFHKAIGVPDTPEGYEIKLPETAGGLELDGDLVAKLAAIAHQGGTSKSAFEAIANAFVQHQVDEHMAEVSKQDELTKTVLTGWGAQKEAKMADCQAAMRALGIDRAEMAQWQAAVGSDKVLQRLAKIGGGIAEDTLITGGTGRFGVSAAEAQAEINRMKGDPTMANKVMVKGSAEQERWNRLNAVVEAAAKNGA